MKLKYIALMAALFLSNNVSASLELELKLGSDSDEWTSSSSSSYRDSLDSNTAPDVLFSNPTLQSFFEAVPESSGDWLNRVRMQDTLRELHHYLEESPAEQSLEELFKEASSLVDSEADAFKVAVVRAQILRIKVGAQSIADEEERENMELLLPTSAITSYITTKCVSGEVKESDLQSKKVCCCFSKKSKKTKELVELTYYFFKGIASKEKLKEIEEKGDELAMQRCMGESVFFQETIYPVHHFLLSFLSLDLGRAGSTSES